MYSYIFGRNDIFEIPVSTKNILMISHTFYVTLEASSNDKLFKFVFFLV